MSEHEQSPDKTTVEVRNIGGIEESTLSLERGVNILAGRNATNRTSFLRALMGALGSANVPLKGDADEGHIELRMGDKEYIRTIERRNGTVIADGDPYLDDPELAELFAFLLESNEVRQAVVRDEDLRDVLMRPVDTEDIEREIDQLREQREEIDRELDEIDELERKLPDLEARKQELEKKVADKREKLQNKRTEIDEFDVELTEDGEIPADKKLEELHSVQEDLEEVRFQLESKREGREALLEEREELENRLEEVDQPDGRIDEIEAELSRLREDKRSVDSLVNQLGSVISFNVETLKGDGGVADVLEAGNESDSDGNVTDQLVEEDTVACWTCGTDVNRDQIKETIDRIDEIRQEQLERRRELERQIKELSEERKSRESSRSEFQRLKRELEGTIDEIDQRESKIRSLEKKQDRLEDEVEDLNEQAEELESESHDELHALHREASELKFVLKNAEEEFDAVETELEEIKDRLDDRENLQGYRGELTENLQELRTRIDRLEQEAVDEFNEHMANLLDILEFDNLERIWIERTQMEVRVGRQNQRQSSFDLHIVRQASEGRAYEDTVDHLSESEREVVGLVFALAGYLVHYVHQKVPFMLLDSLEAIDSDRIAKLVEYFEDYPSYLVVALLPEDADAIHGDHRRIAEI